MFWVERSFSSSRMNRGVWLVLLVVDHVADGRAAVRVDGLVGVADHAELGGAEEVWEKLSAWPVWLPLSGARPDK